MPKFKNGQTVWVAVSRLGSYIPVGTTVFALLANGKYLFDEVNGGVEERFIHETRGDCEKYCIELNNPLD